jgi:hypothetical protein
VTAQGPERREAAADVAADAIHVRAGFHVITTDPLAGGPVELEFFVENLAPLPLQLAVSGDRMRRRPGQFTFAATLDGARIENAMASTPFMGGPVGIVQVSADSPWRQPLILNEFVRLEETRARLSAGASGRLDLECRRPLAHAATSGGLAPDDSALVVAVNLSFDLRRDDAAVAALAGRLLDEVMGGPPALRERPLGLLLSMRSVARPQLEALARHPDSSVASRAQQALAISS